MGGARQSQQQSLPWSEEAPLNLKKLQSEKIIPAICLNWRTHMHTSSGVSRSHLSENLAIKALPFCQRVNSPESESEASLLLQDFSQ